MSRSRIATIALAIALLAAVWSLVLLATGGFDVTLFGVVITAHDVTRPAALGTLAAVVYLVARGPGTVAAALAARARGIDRGLARLRVPDRLASWMAMLIAIVIAVIGVARNSGVVGGADSYGYVSQAELWRQGVSRSCRSRLPRKCRGRTATGRSRRSAIRWPTVAARSCPRIRSGCRW